MKKKTLTTLFIALAVLIPAAFWAHRADMMSPFADPAGKHLLVVSPDEIDAISIRGPYGGVSLKQKDERWVVADRFDYPADFSKISAMVDQVRQARVGRNFPETGEILQRLALKPPEDPSADTPHTGTRILFLKANGTQLADLLVGNPRRGLSGQGTPDSHWVKIGTDPTRVYLIDTPIMGLLQSPAKWLDTPVIEAASTMIREIACAGPGEDFPSIIFQRSEQGKALVPIQFPPGKQVDETVLKRLEWALTYLPLEDVAPVKDATSSRTLDGSVRIEFRLFNHMVYSVFPGPECPEKTACPIRLQVSFDSPPTTGIGAPAPSGHPGTREEQVESAGNTAVAAAELNARLTPWIYYISEGHHSGFITSLGQLATTGLTTRPFGH